MKDIDLQKPMSMPEFCKYCSHLFDKVDWQIKKCRICGWQPQAGDVKTEVEKTPPPPEVIK